jgi:hypothetical protein
MSYFIYVKEYILIYLYIFIYEGLTAVENVARVLLVEELQYTYKYITIYYM